MKIVLDPTWLSIIISIVGIIVPLIVSIYIYKKQDSLKGISYEMLDNISLLDDSLANRAKVYFRRKYLKNVNIVTIRLWNSGNEPIHPDDFILPLTFNFGAGTTLLDNEVLETKPRAIQVNLVQDLNNSVLKPLLLNRSDSIKLRFLLTDFQGEVTVDGRVVGVKQINRSMKVKRTKYVQEAIAMLTISCLMLGAVIILSTMLGGIYTLIAVISASIPLISSIIVLFLMLLKKS